ncbi:MAG: hypothetical protein H0V17_09600 [Deltaproteobacteria bacterium]|nr:hypothetical protein [Deltaproteobacteria bacterium]
MSRRLAILCVLAACAPGWKQAPHDRLFQFDPPIALIRMPEGQSPSDWWDHVYQTTVRPLGRAISPGTYVGALVGGRAARDVNELGQVPDSSWFENRIGRRAITSDEAFRGEATDGGPASGPLLVVSGKIAGISAGFIVRDSARDVWYVKLDHPAFPELSTSAEVISSRLLWLAGYRVPSMHVLDIDRSRFVLAPSAKGKDEYNRAVWLTAQALALLLANTNPDANGRVRMLFSKQPPGKILGSFSYSGTRIDDRNDTIEHEHRRSLRGLWLFSAWLNNPDMRQANTLDMFRPIADDGRGIVEHYLIDFGDAFGSTGLGEKAAVEGWEYLVDWPEVFRNLISFGWRYPPYRRVKRSALRSVGLFEAIVFDPSQWKPEFPNPAFDQRTRGDLFWAASILARIQPDHIRATVTAGHYNETGAAARITEVLLARRAKLLRFALAGSLELDRPRVTGTRLRLDDLRALGDLPQIGSISYVVRWDRTRRIDPVLVQGTIVPGSKFEIEIELADAIAAARKAGLEHDPFLTVALSRHGTRLVVHLRVAGDRVVPISIDR